MVETRKRTKCAICYEYRIDGDEHRNSQHHQQAVARMQQIIDEQKHKTATINSTPSGRGVSTSRGQAE